MGLPEVSCQVEEASSQQTETAGLEQAGGALAGSRQSGWTAGC